VDTINRVFRHLAKRHHPDNPDTGDAARFGRLLAAYEVLSDPAARASFDVDHERHRVGRWRLVSEAADDGVLADDQEARTKILSLLYVQRKREPRSPGLGDYGLASLLDTPVEQLEFQFWYLRSKGFIEREQSGALAITAAGVDRVEELRASVRSRRMLVQRSA
jgi:curved DNA-binding protein